MNVFQRIVLGAWGLVTLVAGFNYVDFSHRWNKDPGDVVAAWLAVSVALGVAWILGKRTALPPKG